MLRGFVILFIGLGIIGFYAANSNSISLSWNDSYTELTVVKHTEVTTCLYIMDEGSNTRYGIQFGQACDLDNVIHLPVGGDQNYNPAPGKLIKAYTPDGRVLVQAVIPSIPTPTPVPTATPLPTPTPHRSWFPMTVQP